MRRLPVLHRADRDRARHRPWQLVCCWTHVRRRSVKRFENEGSPIAEEMPRRIAALYAIEKTVRGKAPADRLAARREQSAPTVAALKPWALRMRAKRWKLGAGSTMLFHSAHLSMYLKRRGIADLGAVPWGVWCPVGLGERAAEPPDVGVPDD